MGVGIPLLTPKVGGIHRIDTHFHLKISISILEWKNSTLLIPALVSKHILNPFSILKSIFLIYATITCQHHKPS